MKATTRYVVESSETVATICKYFRRKDLPSGVINLLRILICFERLVELLLLFSDPFLPFLVPQKTHEGFSRVFNNSSKVADGPDSETKTS